MACSAGRSGRPPATAPMASRRKSRGTAWPIRPVIGVADRLRLVPDVAGQRLVGPLAGQGDLVSLLVHRLGQPQQGGARGVEHRPLGGADQLGIGVGESRAIHRHRGQRRAEHRRGLGGVRALVGTRPVEPDRERRDRLAPLPAATAQDDRRIEAAADVAHDRHVAPQPALDRLHHQALELLDHRRRIVQPTLRARVGEVEVPVPMLGSPARPGRGGSGPAAATRIPSKNVRVVPAQKNVKRWSTPRGSGRAATIPEASSALISEAQSSQPSTSV